MSIINKNTTGMKELETEMDMSDIAPIISQVVQFLMTKSLRQMRRQDKNNPVELGNVNFWLDYKPSGDVRLCFSKHPKKWKEKDIIKDVNNAEADLMMEQQYPQHDGITNPFR